MRKMVAILLAAGMPSVVLADSADEKFKALFLSKEDLPKNLTRTQDYRTGSLETPKSELARYRIEKEGLAVWIEMKMKERISRVVDIRIQFASAKDAEAYYRDKWDSLCEKLPPVKKSSPLGDECRVFGGENALAKAAGLKMVNFIYLLRVNRVIAKLYVAGNEHLALDDAHDLAEKAVRRIEAVVGKSKSKRAETTLADAFTFPVGTSWMYETKRKGKRSANLWKVTQEDRVFSIKEGVLYLRSMPVLRVDGSLPSEFRVAYKGAPFHGVSTPVGSLTVHGKTFQDVIHTRLSFLVEGEKTAWDFYLVPGVGIVRLRLGEATMNLTAYFKQPEAVSKTAPAPKPLTADAFAFPEGTKWSYQISQASSVRPRVRHLMEQKATRIHEIKNGLLRFYLATFPVLKIEGGKSVAFRIQEREGEIQGTPAGVGSVTVPAGTFTAYRTKVVLQRTSGRVQTFEAYVVPGVGLVKLAAEGYEAALARFQKAEPKTVTKKPPSDDEELPFRDAPPAKEKPKPVPADAFAFAEGTKWSYRVTTPSGKTSVKHLVQTKETPIYRTRDGLLHFYLAMFPVFKVEAGQPAPFRLKKPKGEIRGTPEGIAPVTVPMGTLPAAYRVKIVYMLSSGKTMTFEAHVAPGIGVAKLAGEGYEAALSGFEEAKGVAKKTPSDDGLPFRDTPPIKEPPKKTPPPPKKKLPPAKVGDLIPRPHPGEGCKDGCDHHYAFAGRWVVSNHAHTKERCAQYWDADMKRGCWMMH